MDTTTSPHSPAGHATAGPRPRRQRLGLLVAGVLGLILVTTAGSCDERGLGDAPVGQRIEGPRDIIVMPDKFANIAVVCDGPTRIYVTTREAAPVVVPDHPACADQGTGGEG